MLAGSAGSARLCFEPTVLLRGECWPVGHSRRHLVLLLRFEYFVLGGLNVIFDRGF